MTIRLTKLQRAVLLAIPDVGNAEYRDLLAAMRSGGTTRAGASLTVVLKRLYEFGLTDGWNQLTDAGRARKEQCR